MANEAASHKYPMIDLLSHSCLRVVFLAHALAAVMYWYVSPKGFPLDHHRFWLNSVLPLLVIAVACCGMLRNRWQLVVYSSLALACGWLGGSLAGRVLFPASSRGFWQLGVVLALIQFALVRLVARGHQPKPIGLVFSVLLGLLAGAYSVYAQIPPSASTRPINQPPAQIEFVAGSSSGTSTADQTMFQPVIGEVLLRAEEVSIRCNPRLAFDRVSPDGFWSLLAPPKHNDASLVRRQVGQNGTTRYTYTDHTIVDVSANQEKTQVDCVAWATLAESAYSHLNSYAVLTISGHRNLSLAFSPCPDAQTKVLPTDYPNGRPARIAYLNSKQEFLVVEANSGEKGPYKTLATGTLLRGDPLRITFFDDSQRVATVTCFDWTSQLSTELSPTAGWGLPQNAIEFVRLGDSEDAPVQIFITLAATSVGRGWETVGHRAGTYRNHIGIASDLERD